MVILDQIITDNAPTIWYPKKLNGPPLKIPLNLLKPSLTSSSPNNPTAISPQIPPKKCTGTADTGSSTFSLTNNRVPEIIHYTYITYNYTYISYQKTTTQLPEGVLGNSHFGKFWLIQRKTPLIEFCLYQRWRLEQLYWEKDTSRTLFLNKWWPFFNKQNKKKLYVSSIKWKTVKQYLLLFKTKLIWNFNVVYV